MCGIDCCNEIVCCPELRVSFKASQQACAAYRDTVYEDIKQISNKPLTQKELNSCTSKKVSGGIFAKAKQFPHFAVLGYEDSEDNINWLCGGTLISDRFVVTAGHCLKSPDYGNVKYVRLGILSLEINPNEYRSDCPEQFEIIERIPHPNYSSRKIYNDIALLKLDRTVIFDPHIRPACLTDVKEFPDDTIYQAMGFGRMGHDGDQMSPRLLYVHLNGYSFKECNNSYKFDISRRFSDGIIDASQMCAGSKYSIQDTCPGDSGGPLQVNHPSYYKTSIVVGITSFGKSCGFKNSPAIYTRISFYLDWIENIVWPNGF